MLGISAHAAAPTDLIYQYQEQIFKIDPGLYPQWKKRETTYLFHSIPVLLPQNIAERTPLPPGVQVQRAIVWDSDAIASTLEEEIGHSLNRTARTVRIGRGADGSIAFEGVGIPGRHLDAQRAALLTITALEEGVQTIQLPVTEQDPLVSVEDGELSQRGIRELVTIGESDFTGSPVNRRHNIATGIARFNGHLVGAGEEFSFNEILGPVNAQAGYRPELTIQGERTLPEYGGGLCQVSTTAYRGMWKAGFPITQRRNHSYAVIYYAPSGTDATIYPPWTDVRFVNDTGSDLLIQTIVEDTKAYFLYYGSKPRDRQVELVGPLIWDVQAPPPNRIEYTTALSPGTKRILGQSVPGMKTMWYRTITRIDGSETSEPFFSQYEARPYFAEIGIAAAETPLPTEREEVVTEPKTDEATTSDLSGKERWSRRSISQRIRIRR